jgi:hypothetical protein
LKFGLDVS